MTEFSRLVLRWYAGHARELPWRLNSDSYAVWVSEIMLQQTRVETVIPYYERWMTSFPNVQTLASSSLQEVLQLWEGLGYYSRARNLYDAARIVVERYNGKLPADRKELESLPGIGRYTAGAIMSIAFRADEPALDGNIRRVLARFFDLNIPARSSEGEKRLWALLEEHLPPGRAGDFNQGLMDLGSLICTPADPGCSRCPLEKHCQSHKLGIELQRPVMSPREKLPHHTVSAAVIQRDGHVLIARRPPYGLLGGMWEFPGGKIEAGEDLCSGLQREILEELGVSVEVGVKIGIFNHAYTHYKVTLHAFSCKLISGEPQPLEASELNWVLPADLAKYPMGKIDRQIASILSQLSNF